MNREKTIEQYKKNLESTQGVTANEFLIHDVFNEFESRTCGECKKWETKDGNTGGCIGSKYRVDDIDYGMSTFYDFGCNNFERKET